MVQDVRRGPPHALGIALMVRGLLGVFLLGLVAVGKPPPAATEPSSVASITIAPAGAGGYVGAERCRSCHRAEFQEFGKTRHAAITPVKPGAVTGCETCHGPGKPHADAQEAAHGDDAATAAANKLIFAFHANPQKNSERCMVCHQSSRE